MPSHGLLFPGCIAPMVAEQWLAGHARYRPSIYEYGCPKFDWVTHGVAQDDGGKERLAEVVAVVAEEEAIGRANRIFEPDGWGTGD